MAANGNDNLLGLYINENSLRAVSKETSDIKTKVSNVYSGPLSCPFNVETIRNRLLIPQVSQNIEELISKNIAIGGNVKLAIDKSLVLLKNVSVDSDLTEHEIKDHIEWELEQFLISSRDYYNVGYEQGAFDNNGTRHIIVACVRLSVVDYVKDLFSQTPYKLTGVDINLFAASRALRVLYQERLAGHTALLSIEENAIDVVILKDGNIVTWGEVNKTPENQEIFKSQNESLIDYLKTELATLLLGMEEIEFQTIFIDGKANTVFKSALQDEYNMATIVQVDILKNITNADQGSYSVGAEGILAAVGMN
jgi:hypothetical protein